MNGMKVADPLSAAAGSLFVAVGAAAVAHLDPSGRVADFGFSMMQPFIGAESASDMKKGYVDSKAEFKRLREKELKKRKSRSEDPGDREAATTTSSRKKPRKAVAR